MLCTCSSKCKNRYQCHKPVRTGDSSSAGFVVPGQVFFFFFFLGISE